MTERTEGHEGMPEPHSMTELLELRAVVEAAPDAVADILLDVRPGGRSPLARAGTITERDGGELVLDVPGSRITVTVDRAARTVTQQGEWWYRGVTSVRPDERGSLLLHHIFNVASGHGWAVRFLARGPLNAAPATFAGYVAALGAELHCAAWVLDT